MPKSSACLGCSALLPEEAKFCPLCGAPAPISSDTALVVAEGLLLSPLPPAPSPAAPVMGVPGAQSPLFSPEVPVPSRDVVDLPFGKVVLGDVLGDGGMGVVYRGWLYFDPRGPQAESPPIEVAVKILHRSLSGNARVRKLFGGEAEALRRLSHPNIVRFFSLSESDQQLSIVMELIDGQPLSAVIERHVRRAGPGSLPALPFARAWHYFQQLLGALAATHELGIVHRDVKPANLLIRRDGFAKLTDYGIARLPSADAKATGGLTPGTGAYMSPEQVMGRPLDGRSDLYSAAIVLYEMVSGRTPFERPDRNELLLRAAQVEEAPRPLSEFVPQAPRVIDELLARALAKQAHHRFSNAIELGEAFRLALGLPETPGWHAQRVLAGNAMGIAASPARQRKEGTVPVPQAQADEMRDEVDRAYQVRRP